jgi:hypothetical protein
MCKAMIEREIRNIILGNTHNSLEYEIMECTYGTYFTIHENGVFGELLGIHYSIDYNAKEVKLVLKQNNKTIHTNNVECDSCGIVKIQLHEGDKFYGFLKDVSIKIAEIMEGLE